MSNEPYWKVVLPTKDIIVRGQWTKQQVAESIMAGLKIYIDENLQLVKPEPELPAGLTMEFVEEDADVAQPVEAQD